ncbi:MAG: hypothetical protein AB3N33_05300 [Puniceicoccaceae bacterium]
MISDPERILFCVDSDGCVFDNMRWKHEVPFLTALLDVFRLHDHKEWVTDLWLEINLYSVTRGTTRFWAIATFLNRVWKKEASGAGSALPGSPEEYIRFMENPANRNAEAIQRQLATSGGDPCFELVLRWHAEVNRRILESGVSPQPFTGTLETLRLMASLGEVHVVSLTPHDLLISDWTEAGLMPHVTKILGQEFGSKAEQVEAARKGRTIQTLLVGDAPGDEKAALSANCDFFPTIPSREVESWKELNQFLVSMQSTGDPLDAAILQGHVDCFHQTLGF